MIRHTDSPRTLWSVALIACIVFALSTGPARAGMYDVYACDPNFGGGSTPSFGGIADPGLTTFSNCGGPNPIGLGATTTSDGTNSLFQGAFAIFDAPAGTSIDSIHGDIQLTRPDCTWGVGLVASGGDLAGHAVYYLTAGQCGVNGVSWLHQDLSVNDARIRIEARCGASTCNRYAANPARAAMRSVRVTVNDPTPPTIGNPRGSLWSSTGWLSGSQDVAFDASDGSGISRASILVDGIALVSGQSPCDFTQRSPCPNGGVGGPVDTRQIRVDGAHTLEFLAVDAAGNPTQISETVHLDNTAPAAPTAVTVEGGEGWRASNNFTISWANPPNDGGAPVSAAEYQLCRSAGGDCVHGSRAGGSIASLQSLQVPAPGDWTLQVWLRDAAGNSSPSTSAPAVHLRFDDEAPGLSFDPPDPSDPTLASATASDGLAGIASGHIQIRRTGTSSWQTLRSSFDGTHITARLDDEHLRKGTYELAAWAVDRAGNERTSADRSDGGTARVRLPLRVLTRIRAGAAARQTHARPRWRPRVLVGFGTKVHLAGQLLTADGNPIARSEVLVYSRERRGGAPYSLVASVQTSSGGKFAYTAPIGPSRTIRFRFGGTATIRPSIHEIELIVPARSTIRADDTHLINGEYVHLVGSLLGGRLPQGGKLVELQVRLRGHWHTFATTRSDASGRWRYEYRFDGTRGHQIYRLRATIPPESGYPFARGSSRHIAVHVRGL